MTLAEAAAQADGLEEQELAKLRAEWSEEVDAEVHNADYRRRAVAYRAIGQMRFRQKVELLRRGVEDDSPACRGSALVSLESLSRDHPGVVNGMRPLLHNLASHDPNGAVRRLAITCLKNGSPQRETIVLLAGLGQDDEQDQELRALATRVAALLKKRSDTR